MRALLALLALVGCGCQKNAAPEATAADTKLVIGENVSVKVVEPTVTEDDGVLAVRLPESTADPAGWVPSEAESATMSLLAQHDGFDCAEAEKGLKDPVTSLTALVNNVQMPPTVPMRAAHCLVTLHPVEAQPAMAEWLSRDDTYGLFRLVVTEYAKLPADVQASVKKAALAGPYAEEAAQKLK